MSTQMFAYFSLLVIVSVVGINAQLFGPHSGLGFGYAGDSFGTESGYSSSDVFLNPMELAQIMNAQKAEEMRGYSGYGGGGGRAPSYGGGPSYGGPAGPAEPQGPPDGPPSGYGEADHSEGPSDGPNEGSNYHGPEDSDEYSGPPPQQSGGGYKQGGPPQHGQHVDGPHGRPQGGPGDNDGGYSNEGDAYRQEDEQEAYRQEDPAPQSQYNQNEEERAPPGRGNGYNNGPQHVGNGYGQDAPSDNYNGKYKQLIVERPHPMHRKPQGYQNENGYESQRPQYENEQRQPQYENEQRQPQYESEQRQPQYESEQRQPTYESSGYENDKALKPHALPQAQYIQPSSGYSQQEEYESNNSPNERPQNNGGFRPIHGQSGTQTANTGYRGLTKEYYQNDPV